MTPGFTLDAREWQRAAKALAETSSRSCVDFINGQSLRVVIQAVRETEHANAAHIRTVLEGAGRGVSFRVLKSGKRKGKLRTVRGEYLNSFAERILGARFRQTGSFGIKGKNMTEMIRRFIGARTRSANFIRSGWIPARNTLMRIVKVKPRLGSFSFDGAKVVGKPKGKAIPAAVRGFRGIIECIVENSALQRGRVRAPAPGGDPMPIAVKGLQKALDFCAKDMMAELARRLSGDLKRFNAH